MDECTPPLERRTRNQLQRNVIPSSVLRGPCSNACKLPSLPDCFCNGCLCYFHSQCVGLPGEEQIKIFCPDCLRVGRYGKLSPQPIIVEADPQTYIKQKLQKAKNKNQISCLPATDINDFLKSPSLNTRFKALPQSVVIIGNRKFLAIPTGSKSERKNMDPVPEASGSSSSHTPPDEDEVVYMGDTFSQSTSQTHNAEPSREINLLKSNHKFWGNSKASAESEELSLAQPIDLRIQPQLSPMHHLANGNRAAALANVCSLPMDPKLGTPVSVAHDPKAKSSTQDKHKLLYKATSLKNNHVSPRSSLSSNPASCVDGHFNRSSQYGRKPNVSNHADQIPYGSSRRNASIKSQIVQPQQSSQKHASARAAGCNFKTISPKNVMRATVVHASHDSQSRSKQPSPPVSALCRKHGAEYFPRKDYFGNDVQDRRACCGCDVRSTSQPTVEAFQTTSNTRPSKSTAQHDFFASFTSRINNNNNGNNNKTMRESGRGWREQRRKSVVREQPDPIKSFPIKPQNQASDVGSQPGKIRPTTHKKSVEFPFCSKTGPQVNRGTAGTSNSANKSGKYGCSTARERGPNFQDSSFSTTTMQRNKESQLQSFATDSVMETMQLTPEQKKAIQELASTIVDHLSLNNMVVVNHHVDVARQSYEKIFEELKKRNLIYLLNDLRNLQYPIEFCREYRNHFTQLKQYSQSAAIQNGVPDDPISSVNQMAVLQPQTFKTEDDSRQRNQLQHMGSQQSQASRQSQAGIIQVAVHMGINQAEIKAEVGVDLATAANNNKQSLEPLTSSSTYQPSNVTSLPPAQYVYPSTRQSYGNFVITYPHQDVSNEANVEYDLHQHVPDAIPPISTNPGQVGYMVSGRSRYNHDFSTPARPYGPYLTPVHQQPQNVTQSRPPTLYQCACYLCKFPNAPVRAPPTYCSCPDCVYESWRSQYSGSRNGRWHPQ